MLTDQATWRVIGPLFDRLADQPPEQRELESLDLPPRARDLLLEMLAAHDAEDTRLLDQTVARIAGRYIEQPEAGAGDQAETYTGRVFGHWRATGELARGGMAIVLRGERADGHFEKQVAIKLLPDAGHRLHRERLLEEIRILARLEHPNVARLIDGGVSDDGIPFLVMEYIHGEPITRYCQTHRLDARARATLFLQAVDAVAFAHRHRVVHCDIKPDNVLVSDDGQVKLVDFGVAELLGPAPEDSNLPAAFFCSPAYAAPEQLGGASPATTQDIFSLGALLYELISGRRLRPVRELTHLLCAGHAAAERAMQAAPPARAAWDRDLHAICLRALAARVDQRYATAVALKDDLEHWLRCEPVNARGSGRGYRAGKWLQRYRWAAVAGAVAVVSLIAGSAVALSQAHQARAEAELARNVQTLLLDMFSAVDPWRNQQSPVSANEVVDHAVATLPAHLEDHPEQKAEILYALGEILRRMGRAGEAHTLQAQAVALWREQRNAAALHRGLIAQAKSAIDQIKLDGVPALVSEIINDAPWPPRQPEAVQARLLMAQIHSRAGDLDAQRLLLDEALAAEEFIRRLERPDALLGEIYIMAAELAENDARFDAAADWALHAAEAMRAAHGENHPSYAQSLSYLATSRYLQGRHDEAFAAIDQVKSIFIQFYGEDHPQTLWARYTRSRMLTDAGRLEEAVDAYRVIADSVIHQYGEDDPRLGVTWASLGKTHRSLGDLDQAAAYLELGLPITTRHEAEHPKLGTMHAMYAQVLSELGRYEAAETQFDAGLEILHAKLGADHPATANARVAWSEHLVRTGRSDQGLSEVENALMILETTLDASSPQRAIAHQAAGEALFAQGERERAMTHWIRALEIFQQSGQMASHPYETARLSERMAQATGAPDPATGTPQ